MNGVAVKKCCDARRGSCGLDPQFHHPVGLARTEEKQRQTFRTARVPRGARKILYLRILYLPGHVLELYRFDLIYKKTREDTAPHKRSEPRDPLLFLREGTQRKSAGKRSPMTRAASITPTRLSFLLAKLRNLHGLWPPYRVTIP